MSFPKIRQSSNKAIFHLKNNRAVKFLKYFYIKTGLSCYPSIIPISGLLLYRLLLDLIYIRIIYPNFFYLGYEYHFSISRLVFSWLATFCMILPVFRLMQNENTSSIMLFVINLIYFFPLQTAFFCFGVSIQFYICAIIYWIIIITAQFKIPTIQIQRPHLIRLQLLYKFLAFASICYVLYLSWRYTGFRLIFNLNEVYTWRSETATYNLSTIQSYLFSFLSSIIPVFMLYALNNKKYIFAFILLITEYLHFSIDGSKTVLAIILLTLGGYFLYRNRYLALSPWLLCFIGILGIAESRLIGSVYTISYIFRRSIFTPIFLAEKYYVFFTTYTPDFWRSGMLRRFGLPSSFNDPIPNILGWQALGIETAANTGLIGDAISGLGYLGVFLMPILIILCFRIMDMCTQNLDRHLIVGLAIYFSFSFINSNWSIVLLTHGYLITCLLFFLWPLNRAYSATPSKIRNMGTAEIPTAESSTQEAL